MEGEILALQEIVELKKRYKAYLYVDEAHSIGAIGPHGKGVCDYAGVSPADVDILMGTYTKSFASVGGYIAGSKELIAYLRNTAFSALGDTSHSVPCCQQIISAFDVIEGVDGTGDGQVRACSSSLLCMLRARAAAHHADPRKRSILPQAINRDGLHRGGQLRLACDPRAARRTAQNQRVLA
jgi:7-keto-8-aminopelargonate synthetase-like enzyme